MQSVNIELTRTKHALPTDPIAWIQPSNRVDLPDRAKAHRPTPVLPASIGPMRLDTDTQHQYREGGQGWGPHPHPCPLPRGVGVEAHRGQKFLWNPLNIAC